MSDNNSFGGKLKKVLASMCSFVVGASGVSQAGQYLENPGNTDYKSMFGIDDDEIKFLEADSSEIKSLFNVCVPIVGEGDDGVFLAMRSYGGNVCLGACNKGGKGTTNFIILPAGTFLDLVGLYRKERGVNLAAKLEESSTDVDARANLLMNFLVWVFNCDNWEQFKGYFTYTDKSAEKGWIKIEKKESSEKKTLLRNEFYTINPLSFYAEIAKHVGFLKVKKALDDEAKKYTDYVAEIKGKLLGLAKAVADKIPTAGDSGAAQKEFIKSVGGKETWEATDLKDKDVAAIFDAISAGVGGLTVSGVDNGVTDSLAMLGYSAAGDIKAKVVALKKDLLVKLGLSADSIDTRSVEQLLQALADQHKLALENQKGFGKGALVGSGFIGAGLGALGTVGVLHQLGYLDFGRGSSRVGKRFTGAPKKRLGGKPVVKKPVKGLAGGRKGK